MNEFDSLKDSKISGYALELRKFKNGKMYDKVIPIIINEKDVSELKDEILKYYIKLLDDKIAINRRYETNIF